MLRACNVVKKTLREAVNGLIEECVGPARLLSFLVLSCHLATGPCQRGVLCMRSLGMGGNKIGSEGIDASGVI